MSLVFLRRPWVKQTPHILPPCTSITRSWTRSLRSPYPGRLPSNTCRGTWMCTRSRLPWLPGRYGPERRKVSGCVSLNNNVDYLLRITELILLCNRFIIYKKYTFFSNLIFADSSNMSLLKINLISVFALWPLKYSHLLWSTDYLNLPEWQLTSWILN